MKDWIFFLWSATLENYLIFHIMGVLRSLKMFQGRKKKIKNEEGKAPGLTAEGTQQLGADMEISVYLA